VLGEHRRLMTEHAKAGGVCGSGSVVCQRAHLHRTHATRLSAGIDRSLQSVVI